MKERIKKELKEYFLLMRNVPSLTFALFVASVIGMNLLANKSVNLPVDWLAMDSGILLGWLSFLTMDILVKRFGPKAATQISLSASGIYLLLCLVFYIGGNIPGMWGESFVEHGDLINIALDNTISGSWYVLLGSTIAFACGSVVNNYTNHFIGQFFTNNPDSMKAYMWRSYTSTLLGQFIDNLVFGLIVSYNFFGWSLLQVVTCAATGCIIELISEIIFSPFGYKVSKNWKVLGVGQEYLDFVSSN